MDGMAGADIVSVLAKSSREADGRFRSVRCAELGEDVAHEDLHRPLADAELEGDVLVGFTVSNELCDIVLARGQLGAVDRLGRGGRRGDRGSSSRHRAFVNESLGRHEGSARENELDRLRRCRTIQAGRKISLRAQANEPDDAASVVAFTEDDQRRLRISRLDGCELTSGDRAGRLGRAGAQ